MAEFRDTRQWPFFQVSNLAPVWVRVSGLFRGAPNWHERHQPVRWFAPHLVTKGPLYYRTPFAKTVLREGDLFCLWPGHWVQYGSAESGPVGMHFFILSGDKVEPLMRAWGFSPEKPWTRPARIRETSDLMMAIHGSMTQRAWQDIFENISRLYRLSSTISLQSEKADLASRDSVDGLVERAEEIIRFHPETTVQELANILGVSRTTLFTSFRDAKGISPVRAITQTRLAKAKTLMQTTDLKLSAIAAVSGFRNEKYFFRRFKEIEGCTPTEARKKA